MKSKLPTAANASKPNINIREGRQFNTMGRARLDAVSLKKNRPLFGSVCRMMRTLAAKR
jgi:hypothetical protein